MVKQKRILVLLGVVLGTWSTAGAFAQGARMEAYQNALQQKMDSMMTGGAKCRVQLGDSKSGDGQDVEIRITMAMNRFMEFAPIAALEAAGIPHKFPTVMIVLREETADRVGHIAFRDAEPMAGRYLAGDKAGATAEMKKAIKWH